LPDVAGDCKTRIPKPFSLLGVARRCGMLRSQWCQSGVRSWLCGLAFLQGCPSLCAFREGSDLFSTPFKRFPKLVRSPHDEGTVQAGQHTRYPVQAPGRTTSQERPPSACSQASPIRGSCQWASFALVSSSTYSGSYFLPIFRNFWKSSGVGGGGGEERSLRGSLASSKSPSNPVGAVQG
jgi:hypothetical protein